MKKPEIMIQSGIINPQFLHLLARIRHTNLLVIADWAFPFYPGVETIDISLRPGLPSILEVLGLLSPNFKVGRILQAEEFLEFNDPIKTKAFDDTFTRFPDAVVERIPHESFKSHVTSAIGMIRTGDITRYGNIILESV